MFFMDDFIQKIVNLKKMTLGGFSHETFILLFFRVFRCPLYYIISGFIFNWMADSFQIIIHNIIFQRIAYYTKVFLFFFSFF